MNAYDNTYLDDAMLNLGAMADYAVNVAGVSETELWSRFLSCGLATRFGNGGPDIVAGHSGTELAMMVLKLTGKEVPDSDGRVCASSPQYWAGWTLAYYQWLKGLSFKQLDIAGLNLKVVTDMFNPLHEADLSVFVEAADNLLYKRGQENRLKQIRKFNGMTQKELSEKSGVPLRLIRAYEQGTIDLNHAEFQTVGKLSRTLHFQF